MITKRNEQYFAPVNDRIVAAAILYDWKIWTGKRHGPLIQQAIEDGVNKISAVKQGFLTSSGRFVTMKVAYEMAITSGQIKCPVLVSEDLW